MVTVVVTGASGFLGQAVVRALAPSAGVRAVAVSRRPLADARQVRDYGESPAGDVLIHLAEDADRQKVEAVGPPYESQALDVLGRLLLKGYRRVLYASSAALYGDASAAPHRPDDAVSAGDIYARVKLQSERLVAGAPGGAAIRLTNVYGPGMSAANVMSRVLTQIPGSGPLEVRDLAPVRDFLWIEDAAAGFAAMALAPGACGIFNLGTGVGTSVGQVAGLALEAAGERHRELRQTAPPAPASTLIVDASRTTDACGWTPRVSIRDGVERLVSLTVRR